MLMQQTSGDEVRELRFGTLKIVIGHVGTRYVVTLHSATEKDAESMNRAIQKLVEEKRTRIDDGFLSLVSSMLAAGREVSEKGRKEGNGSGKSKASKTQLSARDGRMKALQ